MFDLRMGPPEHPEMAMEVTGAIDEAWSSGWDAAERMSGAVPGVIGSWVVVMRSTSRIDRATGKLPNLLALVGSSGVTAVHDGDWFPDGHVLADVPAQLQQLGIRTVGLFDPSGPGDIHFTLGGDGGGVDSAGEAVPAWVSEFLVQPKRARVVHKLAQTDAPKREVFVPVDVRGAPWSVLSYLTDISRRAAPVPPSAPVLPHPVTGVWLASTYHFGRPRGVRWDGSRWEPFRSRGNGIDDPYELPTR